LALFFERELRGRVSGGYQCEAEQAAHGPIVGIIVFCLRRARRRGGREATTSDSGIL